MRLMLAVVAVMVLYLLASARWQPGQTFDVRLVSNGIEAAGAHYASPEVFADFLRRQPGRHAVRLRSEVDYGTLAEAMLAISGVADIVVDVD